MNEAKILGAFLKDRASFDSLRTISSKEDFGEKGFVIYELIQEFYDRDKKALYVDEDVILSAISRKYPKHEDILRQVVNNALDLASPENVLNEFLELKRENNRVDLGHALLANNKSDIHSCLEEYNKLEQATGDLLLDSDDNEVFIGTSVEELIKETSKENLIPIYPKSLSERVDGGVPKGTHILLFALTEVGKSLFAINMACGMAHAGKKVLFIENEDPVVLTQLRMVSRLSGKIKREVVANPKETQKLAVAGGYENIIVASLSPGSISTIKNLVEKHNPDALFINQLHNLRAGNMTKVEKNEYLATEMRNICKGYKLVGVSITQAADSARDKLLLDDGDVYFSNVGIPSQIDLMLGIGTNDIYTAESRRMVSLCKNKLTGNHEPIIVSVDPFISKVSSI